MRKRVRQSVACLASAAALLLVLTPAAYGAGQDKPTTPPPVRVGGAIKMPVKTKDTKPVYPPLAIQNRTQGVVILEVTVGVDGKVTATKVLKSINMLNEAAIEAAKGREFKPTMVNGVAVPVIMTMPIIFTLG